ncbi:LCI fold-containing protein [Xenorhabdus stockiae]|uniref:LCI fold-containing protein n=1 Tax=Xenorhabdus stockiae TaxID=351614 RepID=UPI003CE7F87C
MLKKLLTAGAFATILIGGIGTASAAGGIYKCGDRYYEDHIPKGNIMWVVNPYRGFANSFTQDGRKWYFQGDIRECEGGNWAGYYKSN